MGDAWVLRLIERRSTRRRRDVRIRSCEVGDF